MKTAYYNVVIAVDYEAFAPPDPVMETAVEQIGKNLHKVTAVRAGCNNITAKLRSVIPIVALQSPDKSYLR